jgi:hypothetical protein
MLRPEGRLASLRQFIRWPLRLRTLSRPRVAGSAAYPPDYSQSDIETIRVVAPFTMTSAEKIYGLLRAVDHIIQADIEGDVVECGVWKGGSMMAVARQLLHLNTRSRRLHLFDTFEGMPAPQDVDRSYLGEQAADLLSAADPADSWVWARGLLEEAQKAMGQTGYPPELISYVRGKVEDTIPGAAPEQIALLRLDTDWYESTYHELRHLYPRLVPGGILILDDYGHWEGARHAVDQYFAEEHIRLFLHRIDYAGRLAIKPG